jgi:hypothetical protein
MLFYILVAVVVAIVLYFTVFRSSGGQRPTIKKDPRLTATAKPAGASSTTVTKKKVVQEVRSFCHGLEIFGARPACRVFSRESTFFFFFFSFLLTQPKKHGEWTWRNFLFFFPPSGSASFWSRADVIFLFYIQDDKVDGLRMTIFYYSQTGTAEDFARRLGDEGRNYSFHTKVVDVEEYDTVRLKWTIFFYFGIKNVSPVFSGSKKILRVFGLFQPFLTSMKTGFLPSETPVSLGAVSFPLAVAILAPRTCGHFCSVLLCALRSILIPIT